MLRAESLRGTATLSPPHNEAPLVINMGSMRSLRRSTDLKITGRETVQPRGQLTLNPGPKTLQQVTYWANWPGHKGPTRTTTMRVHLGRPDLTMRVLLKLARGPPTSSEQLPYSAERWWMVVLVMLEDEVEEVTLVTEEMR